MTDLSILQDRAWTVPPSQGGAVGDPLRHRFGRRIFHTVLVCLLVFVVLTVPFFERVQALTLCSARQLVAGGYAATPLPWDSMLNDPGFGSPSHEWYRPPRHHGYLVESHFEDGTVCR